PFDLTRACHIPILFSYPATAPAAIYTLSLHDALPICDDVDHARRQVGLLADLGEQQRGQRRRLRRLQHHGVAAGQRRGDLPREQDRKSTRLNSSHLGISYAVFCLKKKKTVCRDEYQNI